MKNLKNLTYITHNKTLMFVVIEEFRTSSVNNANLKGCLRFHFDPQKDLLIYCGRKKCFKKKCFDYFCGGKKSRDQ